MNISEHLVFFKQEMQRRNYSIATIDNYSNCLKKFFEQSTRDHPKNINESDIRNFLCTFDEPNTQRGYHSAIKKFYEICLNQKNKFKYIPYCKRSKKLPIVLSIDEIQKMFNVCENLKHRVILSLLYSCGLRVGELLNLQWKDIDRSRMIINIIQGKGKKDRMVVLAKSIIPLLEEYYYKYRPKQYILNGQTELQYTQSSVLQVIKQLATKANINKRAYTHLMRHCCFTHMLEKGVSLNAIQNQAGHSSQKTTAIYCHISHNYISQIESPLNSIRING